MAAALRSGRAFVLTVCLVGCTTSCCEAVLEATCGSESCDIPVSLLQTSQTLNARRKSAKTELSMAYVPYNFGHSVSAKASKAGVMWGDCGSRLPDPNCLGQTKSEVTGCPLMYTPGKLWPASLAEKHFGNKTVFGILRDPYERLVAQFRGATATNPFQGCDVNAGVKKMMEDYLAALDAGNPWLNDCNYLPQAEFFDQPFGATLAVDNRRFPDSMNEVMAEFGRPDLQLALEEVAHVSGCDDKWAADLDSETKALVRKVYKRDFELLCDKFGYCDENENVCLTRVPQMCPEPLFKWNDELSMFEKQ